MTADRTTQLLTGAVAITAPLVIATSGAISYSSLYELARVLGGYGELEAHLFPFPIDFTLGGAVAASFLLARWRAPIWPRAWVAIQVIFAAVVTISGNALHGTLAGDTAAWPWMLRLVVSAVPGAAIVGMTHTVTIMLRCRPRPHGGEEEREAPEPRNPAQARRQTERSAAPKEQRAGALLADGGIALLVGSERAALIARVASEIRASRSYVRKIAGRLESGRGEPSDDTPALPTEAPRPVQEVG